MRDSFANASPSRPGSNIHTPRKAAPRPRSMHRATMLAHAVLALALVPGNPTDLYACEIPLVNASPSRPGSNIHTPRKAAPRPRSMHRCHTRLADLATPQPYPCGPRGSHPSPPLGRHPYLPFRRSRFPDYRPVDACARRSPEPSSEITLIPLAS